MARKLSIKKIVALTIIITVACLVLTAFQSDQYNNVPVVKVPVGDEIVINRKPAEVHIKSRTLVIQTSSASGSTIITTHHLKPAVHEGTASAPRSDAVESKGNIAGSRGQLNAHVWSDLCGYTVSILKQYSHFPHLPHKRYVITKFAVQPNGTEYGQRIFGYIHPNETGDYQFALSADDTGELWLSSDESPENVKLIAALGKEELRLFTRPFQFDKYRGQQSKKIRLVKGRRYFIEALHKQAKGQDHIQVAWRKFDGNEEYKIISSEYISPFLDDTLIKDGDIKLDPIPPHAQSLERASNDGVADPRELPQNAPYVPDAEFDSLLPTCPYDPSYLVRKKLKRYEGINHLHFTSVYPDDYTSIRNGNYFTSGNSLIFEKKAKDVVKRFMAAVKKRWNSKYTLKRIVNVEENYDNVNGARYFIELDLYVNGTDNAMRLSKYIYLPKDQYQLCYPDNFRWNKSADIHVIITVKNQGRWLQHFIDDVSNIYTLTKDNNLNFIIVDYNSNDIDIEAALKRSPLPRYQIITKKGKFRKTAAIQSALDTIDDPGSIVLTLDLHLEIPVNFFQAARKHCVQGKMVFAPLVLRLNCGASPDEPNGFWEPEGFGLLTIYKSDFDRIGGMNTKDFGEGWGGEDTETLDRILQRQLEVERLRIPKFFHFYHSKKGLWNFDEMEQQKRKHVRVRVIKRIIVKRGNQVIRVVNMPNS